MKFGIIVFPGSNCDRDVAWVTQGLLGQPTRMIWHQEEDISDIDVIVIPGGFSYGDYLRCGAIARFSTVMKATINHAQQGKLVVGICNGFQALVKLGLVPWGEIGDMNESSPTLTFNRIGRHINRMIPTRITSVLSPWFACHKVGDITTIPASHGEGCFIAQPEIMAQLVEKGQIATQYVDIQGNPSNHIAHNPNGSMYAVEGITSPDGRILGKMGHSERITSNTAINIPGDKDQKLFESGVSYFS